MLDHSKVTKMHFWMIQSAKIQVFGCFLDLGLLEPLDIAYFGRTICFSTFGNTTRSWWVIQKPSKCVFEWSKEPKNRFLAIYLCQVCWIDLLLPKVIQLNLPQHLAMLLGHEGSFKSHTKVFLNDPKSQKGVFWPLSGVWMVGTTWYFILWLSKSFLSSGDVNRSCIVNEPCIISITHAKRGKNEVDYDD